jgi:hypothetical protein
VNDINLIHRIQGASICNHLRTFDKVIEMYLTKKGLLDKRVVASPKASLEVLLILQRYSSTRILTRTHIIDCSIESNHLFPF